MIKVLRRNGRPSSMTHLNSKKALEREIAFTKVNLSSLYNKNENYKPVHGSTIQKDDFCHHYQKNIPKFKQILEDDLIVDIDTLEKLAWQGIPIGKYQKLNCYLIRIEQRPIVWKILLKYVPLNKCSRENTIARKREEYAAFVKMFIQDIDGEDRNEAEKKAFKLVKDDVHRTQPDFPLFHHPLMQEMMIRLLWIWHVRHPASGYVQGINDLTTPFIVVFLSEHISDINFNSFDVPVDFEQKFTPEVITKVEADTYWCLCKILDGILDNYTFSQSGTHKTLDKIKEITKKIDPDLFKHLEKKGVDFTFFSFRWVFCLLVREFPLKVGVRLFDTYISDEQGFSLLHSYVCSALLLKWSVKLKKMHFTDIMLFLQSMPTKEWSEQDIEMVIAEAYVFRTLYEGPSNCVTVPTLGGSPSLNVF